MKKRSLYLIWLMFSALPHTVLLSSCSKAGTGGQAEVSAYVKHHDKAIPGAVIYIKYNAEEFPGTDLSAYDKSVQTGVSSHGAGHAHIKELKPGSYYFYATGFDSSISQTVSGGRGLVIKRKEKKAEIDLDIPVTE